MKEKPKKIKVRNPELTKKEKVLELLRIVLTLIISAGLCAIAAFCLIAPNRFTIGGASGIAIMVDYVTQGRIPQSLVVFCINTPLVILSFFFVKRRFAVLTLIHTGLQSVWLFLLENIDKAVDIQLVFDGGMIIFAGIGAGLCLGTGIAMIFKVGGSSGGADIIAVMIQKKFPAPSIAWMLFTVNAIIVSSSFFVFYENNSLAHNLLPIIMSLFELYVESKTNDAVTNGFQSAIEFRIITDKPEEMADALMHDLDRGATALSAKGMYTGKEHTMVICVIGRKQVNTLRKTMRKIDPEAFAVMSNVSQVVGLGFYSTEGD